MVLSNATKASSSRNGCLSIAPSPCVGTARVRPGRAYVLQTTEHNLERALKKARFAGHGALLERPLFIVAK